MTNTPEKIGKYPIEALIAKGGMGEVYKGKHPTLNRDVILKKLTIQGNDQFIERFTREARLMMDFKHDNIVNVYDHFTEGNSHYIVLEYVDGEALDCFILRERYLPNDLALYIIQEVSKALKYAHNKGVVHRDIKPGNILISKKGEIKLVDFGIAISDEESDSELTKAGVTLGTPSYMAPEQFKDSKNVDKRADIYSLGVVLYEMVTGKKPYPSGLSPECIANIQKGKRKHPRKVNPRVSAVVLRYIKKLMHHRVKSRVQDLEVVIQKLRKYFKKQSLELYKMRIADSVLGREPVPLPSKKQNKLFLPVVITGLVISGIFLFIKFDYHNEVFYGSSKGALRVNVSVSKGYYKEIDEIFIKSKIFRENRGELNFLKDEILEFGIVRDIKGDYNLFQSKKLYLPEGYYRLKLMVDGNLIWTNFLIEPGREQKKNAHTLKGLLLDLVHTPAKSLPFTPVIKVSDQLSGKELTKDSTILIKRGNSFVKFDPGIKELKTGGIHYFQISKKGYYTKDFILKVSPDQTDLDLIAELLPKPGTISISSNVEGIKLRVNGNKSYIKGDLTREEIKLRKLNLTTYDIQLSPGDYTLQFQFKGNSIEKVFSVESDEKVDIDIKYNKETKALSL